MVALQALALFSTYTATKDVSITLSVNSLGLERYININHNNKLVQQMVKIPTVPTTLAYRAGGRGCVVVQVGVFVSVMYRWSSVCLVYSSFSRHNNISSYSSHVLKAGPQSMGSASRHNVNNLIKMLAPITSYVCIFGKITFHQCTYSTYLLSLMSSHAS